MSSLVTSEIFRPFFNTLTPDDKYSRRNMHFLTTSSNAFIGKRREFFLFFIEFLKCAWNLEHSETKEQYPSLSITEIIASERDVYLSD